jgi:hypothetical protein
MGHALRSTCLLRVEASMARVSQSGLKTGGGAMTGGACGTIVKIASEASKIRTSRCDVLRRTLLSYLCHFQYIGP